MFLASFLFDGIRWWDFWADCGTFNRRADHFKNVAREGANVVKKIQTFLPADKHVTFYENAALNGALLPPVNGWDPVAQAEALVGGASLTMAFQAHPAGIRPLSWNGSPLFAMRPVSTPPPNEPGRVARGGYLGTIRLGELRGCEVPRPDHFG